MDDGELDASPIDAPADSPLSADDEAEIRALLGSLSKPVTPTALAERIDAALSAEVEQAATEQAEVSALLGSLSRPAIPAAVALRIDAALGVEEAARRMSSPAPAPAESHASVETAAEQRLADPAGSGPVPFKPRPSRTRAVFAIAAAAAAVIIVSNHPWSDTTGTVTAAGPTTTAGDTTNPPSTRVAEPTRTVMQVSRHAYHRASLTTEVAAMANGQAQGHEVAASAVPAQWRAVARCAQQRIGQERRTSTAKVDLGWLDGKPSAVILTPGGAGESAVVTVVQEKSGMCAVAATTRLRP